MIHEFTTSAAPSPYPRVSTSKTLLCHITLSHSHTRYPAITPQSNPPPFRTEAPISKIYPSIAPSTIPSSHPINSSYPTHTNYSSPQLPPPPSLNQPHIPSARTKGTKTVSVNASATMNFSGLHLNPRLICKASNFTSLAPTTIIACVSFLGFC